MTEKWPKTLIKSQRTLRTDQQGKCNSSLVRGMHCQCIDLGLKIDSISLQMDVLLLSREVKRLMSIILCKGIPII